MAKHLVRIVLGVVVCLALWVTLWQIRPKVRTNEQIIGLFAENNTLTTSFKKPTAKQVDFFMVALVTKVPEAPSERVEWSISSASGDELWLTNHVHDLTPGTNSINLTGPGNIVPVSSILEGQRIIHVNIRTSGSGHFIPLSLGIRWMEVKRFYAP